MRPRRAAHQRASLLPLTGPAGRRAAPHFPRALQWRVFGWEYLRIVIIGLFASAGRICQTVFLLYLLIAYSNPASSDSEVRQASSRHALHAPDSRADACPAVSFGATAPQRRCTSTPWA